MSEHRVTKKKTTTHSKIDRTKGRYRSLRELAAREGPAKAQRYAQRCFEKGSDWLEWDDMWGHFKFFEVDRIIEDQLTRAMGIEMTSSGTPGQTGQPASSSTPTEPVLPISGVPSPAPTGAPQRIPAAPAGEPGPEPVTGQPDDPKGNKGKRKRGTGISPDAGFNRSLILFWALGIGGGGRGPAVWSWNWDLGLGIGLGFKLGVGWVGGADPDAQRTFSANDHPFKLIHWISASLTNRPPSMFNFVDLWFSFGKRDVFC